MDFKTLDKAINDATGTVFTCPDGYKALCNMGYVKAWWAAVREHLAEPTPPVETKPRKRKVSEE